MFFPTLLTFFFLSPLIWSDNKVPAKSSPRWLCLSHSAPLPYLCLLSFFPSSFSSIRDLKPANIMLTLDNQVKLGDLGLGRYFVNGETWQEETEEEGCMVRGRMSNGHCRNCSQFWLCPIIKLCKQSRVSVSSLLLALLCFAWVSEFFSICLISQLLLSLFEWFISKPHLLVCSFSGGVVCVGLESECWPVYFVACAFCKVTSILLLLLFCFETHFRTLSSAAAWFCLLGLCFIGFFLYFSTFLLFFSIVAPGVFHSSALLSVNLFWWVFCLCFFSFCLHLVVFLWIFFLLTFVFPLLISL